MVKTAIEIRGAVCPSTWCDKNKTEQVKVNLTLDGTAYFWRCKTCLTQIAFYVEQPDQRVEQTFLEEYLRNESRFKDRALLADNKKAFMDDY